MFHFRSGKCNKLKIKKKQLQIGKSLLLFSRDNVENEIAESERDRRLAVLNDDDCDVICDVLMDRGFRITRNALA